MDVPVRVLVVDPQELFRRGLRALLEDEPYLRVVGEAGDGEEALSLSKERGPDVVLTEVALPVLDGVELTRSLTGASERPPKVLVLTTSESDADLHDAVKAGASGYLLKECSLGELTGALHSVVRGHCPISPPMASKLVSEFNALAHDRVTDSAAPEPPLTSRELEVLGLVAQGLSNRDVAAGLYISENTVKNHVRKILEKLRLHSRTQAAMYAVRERLIGEDAR